MFYDEETFNSRTVSNTLKYCDEHESIGESNHGRVDCLLFANKTIGHATLDLHCLLSSSLARTCVIQLLPTSRPNSGFAFTEMVQYEDLRNIFEVMLLRVMC